MRHNNIEHHNIDNWRFPAPFFTTYIPETALLASEFVLARSEDFERTSAIFADDSSRDLMRQLYTFRALGPYHVQLPLDLDAYFSAFQQAGQMRIGPSSVEMPPFEMGMYEVDFLGHKISAECWLGNIVFSFLLKQYFFSRDGVTIAPSPGDYVIDAGACFGDTALAFAAAVGEKGRVFSFEPVFRQAEVLKSNLARNFSLATRTEFYEKAVSDQSNRSITFTDEGAAAKQSKEGSLTVQTITIDDFVRDRDLKKVDFIKADIEGAEIELLHGAAETIRRFKPRLAISAYHRHDDLLTIPQIITSIEPSYQLYLGHHTIHSEETIVYAVRRSD